jgi:outer membrane biosynthesis protein TonB
MRKTYRAILASAGTFFWVASAPAAETAKPQSGFWLTHQAANSKALQSIERLGQCDVRGAPASRIRVPWQIYPKESVGREEGAVVVHLAFDDGWCVQKATIVKSSGYWRLDNVTLEYFMTIKWMPPTPILIDGKQTTDFQLKWGAGQQH